MELTLTQELEKSIRKSTLYTNVVSIVIAIIAALSVTFGFYYTTKIAIERHDADIVNIKKEVFTTQEKVSQIEVFKGVSSSEIKHLEKLVDKIDKKLDKLITLQVNK